MLLYIFRTNVILNGKRGSVSYFLSFIYSLFRVKASRGIEPQER
nr:MAG TPA: hypothetical protein [Bacteriophage sp.]